MRQPIRVLHVLGEMNCGGAEAMVMNLYRTIDRSQVQFDFVIHTNKKCDFDEEIIQLGGLIYHVPRYKGINHFIYKKTWNEFFNNHPEYKIIHAHISSTASIFLKIAKKHGLLTIAHSHITSSGAGLVSFVKDIMQLAIRHTADQLFACSQVAGEFLFGKKACQTPNFKVLNNAINAKAYIYNKSLRDIKRTEFNVSTRFVIGHIGRFHESKNHEFLLDVFSAVYKKNQQAVLVLVGAGELKEKIATSVKKLGLRDQVIFTGIRTDIPDLLHMMDVFLFPSRYEGLPVTLVEAQAASLPCVISDNITNEIKLTSLIESMSLTENSIDEWAEKLLGYTKITQRRNEYNSIKQAGYDSNHTANWYQGFLLEKSNQL